MAAKVDTYSEPPVLVEPNVIDEPELEVVMSQSQSQSQKLLMSQNQSQK